VVDEPIVDGQATEPSSIVSTLAPQTASPNEESRKLSPTRQYWLRLRQIMRRESKERQEKGKGQLFEYLTARQQRHQNAADAIASLGQPRGIDEKALAYATQAFQWHRSGVELYQRAAQMLTFAPASKWSGPFAQSWQSAAIQHRMEEKLLLAKQLAISNYLDSPSFAETPDR